MTLAYSYIRFSSKAQATGDSYRRQSEAVEKYCNEHNLTLSEDNFEDLGVSAWSGANANEDAGLGQFLKACNDRLIPRGSYLLVESLDRLSRQKAMAAINQLSSICLMGIKVVTLIDQQVYTEDANMMEMMMSIMSISRANEESEVKSKRVKESWAKRRSDSTNAKKIKNKPFWIDIDDNSDEYVINQNKAEIVRGMYKLSIDGLGYSLIARALNEQGYKTARGADWSSTNVARIIKGKTALGEYQPHKRVNGKKVVEGEPIANFYPAIIDEETYYLAQSRSNDRNLNKSGRRSDGKAKGGVFSGILKCGVCGSAMVAHTKSGRGAYFTCSSKYTTKCPNGGVPEWIIGQLIRNLTSHPDRELLYNVISSQPKLIVNPDVIEAKLAEKERELAAMLTAVQDFSNKAISDAIASRSAEIDAIKSELEEAKAQASSDESMKWSDASKQLSGLLDAVESGDEAAKRKLNIIFKKYLSKIEVINSKYQIKAGFQVGGLAFKANDSYIYWEDKSTNKRWVKDADSPTSYIGLFFNTKDNHRYDDVLAELTGSGLGADLIIALKEKQLSRE